MVHEHSQYRTVTLRLRPSSLRVTVRLSYGRRMTKFLHLFDSTRLWAVTPRLFRSISGVVAQHLISCLLELAVWLAPLRTRLSIVDMGCAPSRTACCGRVKDDGSSPIFVSVPEPMPVFKRSQEHVRVLMQAVQTIETHWVLYLNRQFILISVNNKRGGETSALVRTRNQLSEMVIAFQQGHARLDQVRAAFEAYEERFHCLPLAMQNEALETMLLPHQLLKLLSDEFGADLRTSVPSGHHKRRRITTLAMAFVDTHGTHAAEADVKRFLEEALGEIDDVPFDDIKAATLDAIAFWSQCRSDGSLAPLYGVEVYPLADRVSWSHPENKYKGQPFAEGINKGDTTSPRYYGKILAKQNKYDTNNRGAASLILCTPGAQFEYGMPHGSTQSNGSTLLCAAVGLISQADRLAVHETALPTLRDEQAESEGTSLALAAGYIKEGAYLTSFLQSDIPSSTARDVVMELGENMCARGFIHRSSIDGSISILMATSCDDVVGSVHRRPRMLGTKPHGLESYDPTRWGSFVRVGAPGMAYMPKSQQEMIEAIHRVHQEDAVAPRTIPAQQAAAAALAGAGTHSAGSGTLATTGLPNANAAASAVAARTIPAQQAVATALEHC